VQVVATSNLSHRVQLHADYTDTHASSSSECVPYLWGGSIHQSIPKEEKDEKT